MNVDSVVRTLLGRGLITEAFTDTETGAIHYGTTDLLLTQLGINSLDELPHISPLLDDGAEGFDDSDLPMTTAERRRRPRACACRRCSPPRASRPAGSSRATSSRAGSR